MGVNGNLDIPVNQQFYQQAKLGHQAKIGELAVKITELKNELGIGSGVSSLLSKAKVFFNIGKTAQSLNENKKLLKVHSDYLQKLAQMNVDIKSRFDVEKKLPELSSNIKQMAKEIKELHTQLTLAAAGDGFGQNVNENEVSNLQQQLKTKNEEKAKVENELLRLQSYDSGIKMHESLKPEKMTDSELQAVEKLHQQLQSIKQLKSDKSITLGQRISGAFSKKMASKRAARNEMMADISHVKKFADVLTSDSGRGSKKLLEQLSQFHEHKNLIDEKDRKAFSQVFVDVFRDLKPHEKVEVLSGSAFHSVLTKEAKNECYKNYLPDLNEVTSLKKLYASPDFKSISEDVKQSVYRALLDKLGDESGNFVGDLLQEHMNGLQEPQSVLRGKTPLTELLAFFLKNRLKFEQSDAYQAINKLNRQLPFDDSEGKKASEQVKNQSELIFGHVKNFLENIQDKPLSDMMKKFYNGYLQLYGNKGMDEKVPELKSGTSIVEMASKMSINAIFLRVINPVITTPPISLPMESKVLQTLVGSEEQSKGKLTSGTTPWLAGVGTEFSKAHYQECLSIVDRWK